jgi:hypothetical protein
MEKLFQDYINSVSTKYAHKETSEMGYRTDLENLLGGIFTKEQKYHIHHDAKAVAGNKPDYVILKNNIPILYIEAKDIGVSLDKIEKSNQMERYFGYGNLILTDYVEFRFYRNGVRYEEPITIATFDKDNRVITEHSHNYSLLAKTLLDFASTHKEPIKHGKHLAQIMGGKAQRIRDNVKEMLLATTDRYIDLVKMRDVVKEHLVSSLDDESFADMYAQTLVYGLFAARYNDKTSDTFSRVEARELVPKTNPFLRSFFDHIAGESFPERLAFIVDELCEVFTHADVNRLMHEYFTQGKLMGGVHSSPDPVIHFYEDFLREYDVKKKMEMGVFYTPKPVVQFIVRAVDDILKSEFGLEKGLNDTSKVTIDRNEINGKGKEVKVQKEYHKVQILDVATGTGTFLNEVINHIHSSFKNQEGRWSAYVENDLLPRLHGFELMMASYTIAHLKLGMTLQDSGADNIKTRLGVYLTNTLEAPVDFNNQHTLFGIMDSIAQESKSASRVKTEYPIMCVIGNPPYSGISMNKHYTDNNVYKVEPGGLKKLDERKNWLDDDYVKFIRFAESLVEKNGEGVISMITAHGYIDNPTFRGMRWHLRKTFDKIYIVDLHGNSNKKETSPDGSKDENVFDIKTGVSIILGLKKRSDIKEERLAQVFQTDFYGTRENKYEKLERENIEKIQWNQLFEDAEVWRVEGQGKDEYQKGFSVAKLFPKNTTGIVTARDSLVIDPNKDELLKRIQTFCDENKTEQDIRTIFFGKKKEGKYKSGDSRGWKLDIARKKIKDFHHESFIQPISYRPLDTRYIYYSPDMVDWGRFDLMQNLINRRNIGLVLMRQATDDSSYNHIVVSNNMVDNRFMYSGKGITLEMPLYLYDEINEKIPNLDREIWGKINTIAEESTPENILDYTYAYLHSPDYREKYKEFLKTDFPRVPYPKNKDEFWKLVSIGTKLRELHLMMASECSSPITTYSEKGDNVVEKIKYEKEKVYINDNQYFGNVPEVSWNFYIGGYQPAQKWLKDRKGRTLTNDDIEHYQKIIIVLTETDRIMKKIDSVIKN